MKAFIVELDNRPGELARIAAAIAEKGINITNGAGLAVGNSGGMSLMTNDEEGTRKALDGAGCRYREVELISVPVEDRPGSLANVAKRLGDAGVNIELLVPSGMSGSQMTLAIGVDNADAARQALGEMARTTAATA